MHVVSVYDRVTRTYNGLFAMASLEAAVRSWSDSILKDEIVQRHPEDFSLRKVGEFNEESGVLKSDGVEVLVEAEAVIRQLQARQRGEETRDMFDEVVS